MSMHNWKLLVYGCDPILGYGGDPIKIDWWDAIITRTTYISIGFTTVLENSNGNWILCERKSSCGNCFRFFSHKKYIPKEVKDFLRVYLIQ